MFIYHNLCKMAFSIVTNITWGVYLNLNLNIFLDEIVSLMTTYVHAQKY